MMTHYIIYLRFSLFFCNFFKFFSKKNRPFIGLLIKEAVHKRIVFLSATNRGFVPSLMEFSDKIMGKIPRRLTTLHDINS